MIVKTMSSDNADVTEFVFTLDGGVLEVVENYEHQAGAMPTSTLFRLSTNGAANAMSLVELITNWLEHKYPEYPTSRQPARLFQCRIGGVRRLETQGLIRTI